MYLDNHLKWGDNSPIVDGSIKYKDTKFTIVLPQSDPSLLTEGIVEFIDQDNPSNDQKL
jgi:hypothetical protein